MFVTPAFSVIFRLTGLVADLDDTTPGVGRNKTVFARLQAARLVRQRLASHSLPRTLSRPANRYSICDWYAGRLLTATLGNSIDELVIPNS